MEVMNTGKSKRNRQNIEHENIGDGNWNLDYKSYKRGVEHGLGSISRILKDEMKWRMLHVREQSWIKERKGTGWPSNCKDSNPSTYATRGDLVSSLELRMKPMTNNW